MRKSILTDDKNKKHDDKNKKQKEVWKLINYGLKNYYISNYGNVKNINPLTRYKNKRDMYFLKPWNNGNGYLVVSLCDGVKRKNFYIHRLVAESFIGKIPIGSVINHKDYNTKNNYIENLEICTQKENITYSRERMFKQRSVVKSNTGHKNIRFKCNRFEVNVSIRGKKRYVGRFKNIDEAIKARDLVYAKINFDR